MSSVMLWVFQWGRNNSHGRGQNGRNEPAISRETRRTVSHCPWLCNTAVPLRRRTPHSLPIMLGERLSPRHLPGLAMVLAGVGGAVADLLGVETIPPAYFAVLIGAGSAALPGGSLGLCHLRDRLPGR